MPSRPVWKQVVHDDLFSLARRALGVVGKGTGVPPPDFSAAGPPPTCGASQRRQSTKTCGRGATARCNVSCLEPRTSNNSLNLGRQVLDKEAKLAAAVLEWGGCSLGRLRQSTNLTQHHVTLRCLSAGAVAAVVSRHESLREWDRADAVSKQTTPMTGTWSCQPPPELPLGTQGR